jgi:hypothetical protein
MIELITDPVFIVFWVCMTMFAAGLSGPISDNIGDSLKITCLLFAVGLLLWPILLGVFIAENWGKEGNA